MPYQSSSLILKHLALVALGLGPGDEVIVPAPFFVEYLSYVDHHGGVVKLVKSKGDFSLDLWAIEEAITEKTKAPPTPASSTPRSRCRPRRRGCSPIPRPSVERRRATVKSSSG